jgi:hypothetical protein
MEILTFDNATCQLKVYTNDKKIFIIQDFFYEYENKNRLANNFFQNVVELENHIYRDDKNINESIVEELADLYKVK